MLVISLTLNLLLLAVAIRQAVLLQRAQDAIPKPDWFDEQLAAREREEDSKWEPTIDPHTGRPLGGYLHRRR